MSLRNTTRAALVALSLSSIASFAFAENWDIYSRLFEMQAMDKNKDAMVGKKEFMDMISKAWDMKAQEMNVKSDKLSADHIKELEKTLGRVLSSHAGS